MLKERHRFGKSGKRDVGFFRKALGHRGVKVEQCTELCEAARVNTMTGSLDLSFGFPRNGKIPHPHQVTWSQPINMRPVRNKGRAEKPAKVCTNKIALQTCSLSA